MLLQLIKMPNSKECACKLQRPTVCTGRQHIGFTILPTRLMERQLKRSTPYPLPIAAEITACNSMLSEGGSCVVR